MSQASHTPLVKRSRLEAVIQGRLNKSGTPTFLA